MNSTRITYQYRDNSNNKAVHAEILSGEMTEALRARLAASLLPADGSDHAGDFVPGQVGLKDLQNAFYERHIRLAEALADIPEDASDAERAQAARAGEVLRDMRGVQPIWWPDDGPFHELLSIETVTAEPTLERDIADLVAAMEATTWDADYKPPFYEEMRANYERRADEDDDPGIA